MVPSFRFLSLAALLVASSVCAASTKHKRLAPTAYESCIKANDIALTFDDGPWIHLRNISDAFTKAGAKATFFMNGNNWDCIYNPARIADVKYAYAAGHQIGSHTWSHASLTAGLTNAQIQDGMYRMEEAFSRILGIKPAFMRPPFGDYNQNVENIAAGRDQALALWDWDTGDADGNTTAQSEAVYNDIASSMPKNALVLEHETEDTTAAILVPYAIKLFQGKGYNLVTLADCLGVDPYVAIGVPQQQTSSWTCDGTPDPGDVCGGSSGITCETGTPPLSTTTSSAPSGPTSPAPPPAKTTFIHPSVSSSKCLSSSSNADGTPVAVQDCITSGDMSSQNWTISGSNIVLYGNKCLDVTNGVATSGTKLQIWTCTTNDANQAWTVNSASKSVTWSGKGFCLDLTDGSLTDGNVAQIWGCSATAPNANQQWTIAST